VRRRLATFVAAGLLVVATGLAAAGPARADGPPAAPPPAVPAAPPVPPPGPLPAPAPAPIPEAKPAPAPGSGPTASARPVVTAEDLERLVIKSPAALGAMVLLKYGSALAGLVIALLAAARWWDVRRGLAPPLPTFPPPPAPFSIVPALVIAIVAVLGGGLFVLGLTQTGAGWNAQKDPIGVGITATALFTVPAAALIGTLILLRRREQGLAPWPPVAAIRTGVVVFCVASLVVLATSFLATWAIQEFLHRPPEAQDLIGHVLYPVHPKDPWLIACFGVLVAPVTEELVFRGMLYPGLRTKLGPWLAALASAALFGLVHDSLSAFLPLFALALVLARLYERTGSLLACIVVHALNNATSLLPLFLLHR